MKKTIVILANSVKHGQHCVAGKDVSTKQWIRPVRDAGGGELSSEQTKCKNPHGVFPISVLQKIEMGFSQAAPLINQPENHIITDETWLQRYKMDKRDLHSFLDHPEILWNNQSHSGNGENDRVDYHQIINRIIEIKQSLYLIKPEDVKVIIIENSDHKKRIRIFFKYKNISYNLATTDPVLWKEYSARNIGEYYFETPKILCISLGEKFDDGFCYKLVASAL